MGLRPLIFAATAMVLVLAQHGPVRAQFGVPAQAGVPPYEVLAIVRSKGLEPLSRPQRHGGSYTLRAVDPRGREFQVTVDARIARIIKIAPFVRHPAPAGEANAPARVAPDGLSPNSRMVHGSEGQIADEEDGGLPGAASRSRAARRLQPLPEVPPLPRPRPQSSTPASSDAAFSNAPKEEPPRTELEE